MIKHLFSIGGFISALGLLTVGAGTWFGMSLSGESPAISAALGLVVLIIGGAAVFVGGCAKTASSDFAYWRKVEIGCVGAMCCVFAFALLPTAKTFNFMRHHGELVEAAVADIDGIDSLVTSFDRTETERMNATFRGLENYLRLGNRNCSPALAAYIQNTLGSTTVFFSQNIINNNRGTVQAKIDDLRLGNRMYRNTFNNALDRLDQIGTGILPLGYAALSQQLDTISAQVGTVLTDISSSLNLPVVYAGRGDQYTVRETEPTVYTYRPHVFAAEFAAASTLDWVSLALAALSVAVAVFYYLITYRALRKAVDKGQKVSDGLGLPI